MTHNPTDEFFNTLLQSEQSRNAKLVEMLTLVDMGTIQAVDINGRATVVSNKIIGGEAVTYHNVEVIGIGNDQGGFIADGVGCTCLILVPRSAVPTVDSDKVRWDTVPYSQIGIKAIPVTSTYSAVVRAGFNASGVFSITTPGYTFTMDRRSIMVGAEGITLFLDENRKVSLYRRTTYSGEVEWALSDAGIDSSFVSNDKTVSYKQEIHEDSITTTIGMGSPSDDKYPNTYQLQFKDGALTITHTDGDSTTYNSITIGVDGAISISTPGDVSVEAGGDVSLSTDGDLSAEVGGDMTASVTGDASISATGITLTGTAGKVEIS